MSLLLKIVGLAVGGFLVVGGLASVVLGVYALGENPARGVQVLLFSLLVTGIGGWMLWESLRGWLKGRRAQAERASRAPSEA
ncbi:MAG: hypothetical protein KGN39_04095 [Betaproteobacteria bacterium]|nr:hypothetical protein [Betaproteobacteria bacterium]